MKHSKLATYAVGIAVAAALAGCGGSDDGGSSDFADGKTADIVDAASKAMGDLESLSISGETKQGGESATLDLQLSSSGDCTGTISFDTTGTIEILGVGDDRWFKGDESFWSTTGIPDTSMVLDKWVIDAQDDFAQFCNVDDFVGQMFEDDTEETFKSKGTDSVDGDDVVVVEQDDAEEGVSTGYILVNDPHYMVKVEKEGDDGGTITFSGFDEEFEVTAPGADEIVDLDQLG
jgi:hypothetical protein